MQKQIRHSILTIFAIVTFCQITYSQTFGGIGAIINIDTISKFPFIAEVKKGMPAEKMNLQPKDVITKINGQSTYGYTLEQTVSQLRGVIGSTCSIIILRNNKEYPFTLTRAEISLPTDRFAFTKLLGHICSNKLPEKRYVNIESENYKQSLLYLQEANAKPARSNHFLKLAVETCNDNLQAHLAYADSLKRWKDGSMRYSAQVYGPPIPKEQIYNPKNWQHFPTNHEDAYGNVLEQYDSVLAIEPKHLRARLNVADIYYFNGKFDSCTKNLLLLICAIPTEQHNSEACIQARRMIRRCEWLKSLPENSIKLNTLYWDKGRAETLLFTLGTAGMTVGEIFSKSTGNISGALIGAGFNAATMLLQKSRESLKWLGKGIDAKDYKKVYEKCQDVLPQKINSTGFYSYETMAMLSGIIYAGTGLEKKYSELRHNAFALVDIVQIANPEIGLEYTDYKFFIRQGLQSAFFITEYDKSLTVYEELNLYNFLLDFNKRLTDAEDKSFFPSENIEIFKQRKSLLSNFIDSLSNANQKVEDEEKVRKEKLQNKIDSALETLSEKPTDIEARSILATSYEEQGDYKSAIIHYEYLLNYYKQKKNTNKTQEVNMHLKGCRLLLEKNNN